MQFPGAPPPPPKKPNQFIFDSDMGNRIDSALALALVYGHSLHEEAEADVAAIGTSKANVNSAAFYDIVRRFFERPTLAGAEGDGPPGRRGPRAITYNKVGYRMGGNTPESTPLLDAVVDKKDVDGKFVYPRELDHIADAADSVALLRDTLDDLPENRGVNVPDGAGVIIGTGPATNLARLMNLSKMKDTIQQKVRLLVVAMGRYPSGADAAHIAPDVEAARKLFAEWPTPIVACGAEIGDQVKFPGASVERHFGWTANHPIADAYRAFQPMPYDATAWETSAALYAVQPDAGYFKLSAPGRITVGEDGGTSFEEAADGQHRYLIFDESKRAEIAAAMASLVSTQPLPLAAPTPPPPPAA